MKPERGVALWLPAILIVLLTVTLVFSIANANGLREVIDQRIAADYTDCEARSAARVNGIKGYKADLRSLEADLENLRGDIDFVRAVAGEFPEAEAFLDVKRRAIIAKEASVTAKELQIQGALDAYRDVADPHGPPGSLDCDKVVQG